MFGRDRTCRLQGVKRHCFRQYSVARLGSLRTVGPVSALQFELETVEPSKYPEWLAVASRGFHNSRKPSEPDLEWRRKRWSTQRLTGAVADERVVGTFRSWDDAMPVPGGSVRADWVSTVTVAPTHRRRGILNAMMTQDLRAAKDSGTPLAILLASEGSIYGRYGYGAASEHCTWTLTTAAARFAPNPDAADYTMDLVSDADLRAVAPGIYAEAAAGMPGAMPRDGLWWDAALGLAGLSHDDATAVRHALLLRDGTGRPIGYARYKVTSNSEQRVDTTVLEVHDLASSTAAGYAELWRFLSSTDLVATVRADDRPVHEPLPWLLAERRAARQSERADFHWIRLLDVQAALTARTFNGAGRWVLQVSDPMDLAGGRFALSVDETGQATVVSTTDAADVELGIDVLGSVYLGQIALADLHVAGRVTEIREGAVASLGATFAHQATSSVGHSWF